jgi:SAM-dependent methyltransferase
VWFRGFDAYHARTITMNDQRPSRETDREPDRAAANHERWEQRYLDGDLPWDSGTPDRHLTGFVEELGATSGKVLDIGCGTGTNVVWLAQRGFEVVALDLSPTAIEKARARVEGAGVQARLLAADFLADNFPASEAPGGPFRLVFDRGCFHVFEEAEERSRFAARVADLLEPEGLWLSVLGSADGPPRSHGPPRRRAAEIVTAVEPHLEILHLESTTFVTSDRAWRLVARRRAPDGRGEENARL